MKIIYEDENIIVLDKPAGIAVFSDNDSGLMAEIVESNPELKNVGEPPRYGLIHRLDKDTSGLLLVAKNNQALSFFQKQFRTRDVRKKYIALVWGKIQEKEGIIKTLINRDKDGKKQRAYPWLGPLAKKTGSRLAETQWKMIEEYDKYTLIEAIPKTGRKHQIRVHFSYIGHPIIGDKLYSFKNQIVPKVLTRQFLHASGLTIKLMDGEEKTFSSPLPDDLKQLLKNL
ncbi:RluA family pseudouridine synthase [Patescibacteria group bacterium]|nr:RluA family pseudouridine synthase [Patescibacteria group bacterium]MBU4162285.1 RluA family pseudouridine synthase [Patescibacteria group bacterium]